MILGGKVLGSPQSVILVVFHERAFYVFILLFEVFEAEGKKKGGKERVKGRQAEPSVIRDPVISRFSVF